MSRFVTVVGFFSTFRQKCCGSRRLAGGASESEMTPIDKSPSAERVSQREAGGGCPPPPNCTYSSNRCGDSSNVDCSSSIASSCCPSRCEGHCSPRTSSCCQPCVSPLRSILKKKRGCCCDRCSGPSPSCMCQPMPRGCNCPPPVQVDARAARDCTCDCPSSPECACPPSERRFPRTTKTCPNARLCRPFPRPSPGPKCHNNCIRYQPDLPPPCDSCASSECRASARVPPAPRNPCSPCSPCSPCRSASPASTGSSCRPPTACRRLSICDERRGPSTCSGTGQSCRGIDDAVCSDLDGVEEREIETSDTEDRDGSRDYCCATERVEAEDQPGSAGDSSVSIPDEGSVEDSASRTSVNSSPSAANTSRPVGPHSTDTPVKSVEYVAESKEVEVLEGLDGEKDHVMNDLQSTLPSPSPSPRVPPDNHAKSDRREFRRVHPSVGKNILRNLVRVRLLDRARSPARLKRQDLSAPNKLSTQEVVVPRDDSPRARDAPQPADVNVSNAPTRANDRRREDGGSSAQNTADSNGSSREIRVIRWSVSKPPSPVTRGRSASASLRSSGAAVVFSQRKSTQPPSTISQGDGARE